MNVKIKILSHGEGLPVPKKATEFAACVDLYAAIPENEDCEIMRGQTMLVPCGFCIEVPVGYEAQVRPRSGIALKNGVTVLNSPGTIDADYRGEVKVMLYNVSDVGYSSSAYSHAAVANSRKFKIRRGDRIAQMTIKKVEDFEFEVVEELSVTDRGVGGFGHTGK